MCRVAPKRVARAIGQPEDLAAAIAFGASAEARCVKGTTLVADGGRLDIL
jgi:NAD(P)-dependent dehydrogenase (short-subunit alcohol dehydrogenase family)